MRYLFLLSIFLLALISCTPNPQTDSTLSTSTQDYAVPEFEDVKTFDRMEEAFPVISQLFLDYAKANNFPSISFGIVARGKLEYTESSGSANLSLGIKPDSNTLYRIASMSKSFTAMAILKLRDEGRLNLFDPVSNYLPEMDLAGKLTADAPEITIHHLLTMSAGFPEDNPWGDRQLDATDEELLEVLESWEEDKLGIFADNFFLDEPLERRKAAADIILLEAGPIQETSKITALNQLRGSFIIQGENKSVEVFFTLNPQREALVQWLGLRLVE